MWLGCPIAIFAATFAFYGLGGVMSQPAGFSVYIGNPKFIPAALVYFAGLGVVMYLGAGGAVIGGSPVYAPAFKFYASGNGANYYIQGATVRTLGFGVDASLCACVTGCVLSSCVPSGNKRIIPHTLTQPNTLQEYVNGIGYFDKNNPQGLGYLYDKEPKNKTAVRMYVSLFSLLHADVVCRPACLLHLRTDEQARGQGVLQRRHPQAQADPLPLRLQRQPRPPRVRLL